MENLQNTQQVACEMQQDLLALSSETGTLIDRLRDKNQHELAKKFEDMLKIMLSLKEKDLEILKQISEEYDEELSHPVENQELTRPYFS